MTEKELRELVVKTATAWLGRKESNGTHKVIIDEYNKHRPLPRGYAVTYSDAWCATFVSAVGIKLGIADVIFPECSCYYMIELFKKAGRWVETDKYKPQVGDIVMYDWQDNGQGDNTGVPDHVGIVAALSGGYMHIIEGNIDNAVGYRTLDIDGKYIRGYCLPDYAKAAGSVAETEKAPASPAGTYVVKKGDALWDLSEKWLGTGTRYREIMTLNNLKTDILQVGQELIIPGTTAAKAPATSQPEGGDDAMKTCTVTLPKLAYGDKGQAVKALQTLLILRGYKLPNHGVDGDFGSETKTVLELFQKKANLTVDGIAGPKTWKEMIG